MTPLRARRPTSSRPEVLRVLDPEAAVARAVRPGDAVVDVEREAVGALADGVDRHLETGRVRRADPGAERVLGSPQQARRRGVVIVGRVEQRGGRAERAVHVALHAADPHPVVAPADRRDRVRHRAPALQREVERGAGGEGAGRLGAQVGAEIGGFHAHVGEGGDALGRRVGQRAAQGRVPLPVGRSGHRALHRTHRHVLEHAGRLTGARIAHDDAAGDVPGGTRDLRCPERGAVGQPHVPVEPVHEHRIIGRDRIDPLAPWQRGAGPALVVPVRHPRIHSPGRRSAAKALSRAMNSPGVSAGRRSTLRELESALE